MNAAGRAAAAAAARAPGWLLSAGLGLLLLAGGAACSRQPNPAASPATDCNFHGGAVHTDLTLRKACSPITVRGGIDVLDNAVLTIEPGVEMRFQDRDWLEIAAAGSRGGKLIARGTAQQPIILTSASPETVASGTWYGLWFNSGTAPGSVLSHAVVRAAGGKNKHIKPTLTQGCITLTEVAPDAVTLDHVQLEGCVQAGLVLRSSRPQLREVSLSDMAMGVLVSPELEKSIPAGVSYHNVQKPLARRAL